MLCHVLAAVGCAGQCRAVPGYIRQALSSCRERVQTNPTSLSDSALSDHALPEKSVPRSPHSNQRRHRGCRSVHHWHDWQNSAALAHQKCQNLEPPCDCDDVINTARVSITRRLQAAVPERSRNPSVSSSRFSVGRVSLFRLALTRASAIFARVFSSITIAFDCDDVTRRAQVSRNQRATASRGHWWIASPPPFKGGGAIHQCPRADSRLLRGVVWIFDRLDADS